MLKPKYQEISDHLIEQIKNGQLNKGDKLPSIRLLSKSYHCSKDTVQKALLDLSYQKYIYAVPKSGYYVLEQAQEENNDLELPLRNDRHQVYEDFRICLNETLIFSTRRARRFETICQKSTSRISYLPNPRQDSFDIWYPASTLYSISNRLP